MKKEKGIDSKSMVTNGGDGTQSPSAERAVGFLIKRSL